jgi:copper chaperone CopZ
MRHAGPVLQCTGQVESKEKLMASMMEHATVTATDISCAHCVATVKAAVGTLPGVASVEADPHSKRVEIDLDSDRVSLAQIAAALDEAGYPIDVP